MMRQGGNGQIKRYFRKMEIDQSTIYTLYASKVSDHYRQLLKERVLKVMSGEIRATRRLMKKVDRSASDTALRKASEDNYRDRVGSSFEALDVLFSTGPMGMTIANDHMHRAVVSKVVIDGPADHAGVLIGDCITSIDGKSAEDYEHVMQLIMNGPRPISLRFSRLVRQSQQQQQQQISRSRSLLVATSLASTSDDANDDFVINANAIDIEALNSAAHDPPPITYIQGITTSTASNMKSISDEDRAFGKVITDPPLALLDDTSNLSNKDIALTASSSHSITGHQPTLHSSHSSSNGWGFTFHDHDCSADISSSGSDEYQAMMRVDIKTAFDEEVNGDVEFSSLQAESDTTALTPTPICSYNNAVEVEETSEVTAAADNASSVQDSSDSVDVQSDIEYLEKIASLLLVTELSSDQICTPEFTPISFNDSKFFPEFSPTKSHASSGKSMKSDEYMEFTVVYKEGPIGLTFGYVTAEGSDNDSGSGREESCDRLQEQSLIPHVTDVATGGQSELLGVVVGDLLVKIGVQVVSYCEVDSMQQLLFNSTFPLHVKFRRKKL